MLAEHCQGGAEGGRGEAQEKNELGDGHHEKRPGRLWEGRNLVSEGVVDFIEEDTEEVVGLITWVGLDLRVRLSGKCCRDGGKQASLSL